jgi:hypothetical protein
MRVATLETSGLGRVGSLAGRGGSVMEMSKGETMFARAMGAALALGLAAPALAGVGNGIRLGGSEGRLHPFLEVEGRYDSNVLFETSGKAVDDFILHFRPGLTLDVPGETTSLKLSGAFDWAQYLGVSGDTTDLSKLYGNAAIAVDVNRRGAVGLEFTDDFKRGTGTTSLSISSAVISNDNRLRVAVPWRPGGGALILTVAGTWHLETFEPFFSGALCDPSNPLPECNTQGIADLGYNELGGSAQLKWKFLPRTATLLEGEYFSRLPNEADAAAKVNGLRVQAGVTGLLTPRLAGTLKGGYGQTRGDVEESTWLASAEVEWLASETTSARLGYAHDIGVDPGNVLSVYTAHRAYLEGKVLLGGRVTAKLLGQVDARDYTTGGNITATLYRVEPSLDVELVRWLRLGVGYAYTDRTSDLNDATALPRGFDYAKSEAWLRLTGTY